VANHLIIFKIYYLLPETIIYETLKNSQFPQEGLVYIKVFSTGIRIANILHARLRQKCSSLKYDLFRCNLIVIYILNTEYNYK
jgi:hypothetical protein